MMINKESAEQMCKSIFNKFRLVLIHTHDTNSSACIVSQILLGLRQHLIQDIHILQTTMYSP